MSTPPPNPTPTAEQLRAECHRLIEQLYRHRLNVKLLLTALNGLQMAAGYKANRSPRSR